MSLKSRYQRSGIRSEGARILIVCDGKNTEPSYFRKLQKYVRGTSIVDIFDIHGEGTNTLSTIEYAKRKYTELKNKGINIDEVWCVFDGDPKRGDPNHLAHFDAAVAEVTSNKRPSYLQGAYSYEAFEYWFVLHFENHDGSHITRGDDCLKKINKSLPTGVFYDKKKRGNTGGGEVTQSFFDELMKNMDSAIKRAKSIDLLFKAKGNPYNRGSTTRVFLLVEKILGR